MNLTEPERELARTIWEASRVDEGSISATGANIIARTLIDHGYGKLPLDPLPYYVEEADLGRGPDDGRYSRDAYLEDARRGEWGGTMSNLAQFKPREEFAQGQSAYREVAR